MPEPFKLTVPADERYRVLAPEVAGKYVELMGGTAADGTALAAALNDAVDTLLAGGGPADGIEVAFRPGADGIEVNVAYGGRSTVINHPPLASKE
jgi:hypothetical protein